MEVVVSYIFTVVSSRRMSRLCFGGQCGTAVDCMGEIEVGLYFVLMLSNSLRMIEIDQNMGLGQIVCKRCKLCLILYILNHIGCYCFIKLLFMYLDAMFSL